MEQNKFVVPTSLLVLSIIEIFCCNQVTGILSIVFFCLAEDRNKKEMFDERDRYIKFCKISLIVGPIVSIVLAILYVAFIILLAFSG